MKIAVLVNEDFSEMVLGVSTSLSYILGACDLGREVFVVDCRGCERLEKDVDAISIASSKDLVDSFVANSGLKVEEVLKEGDVLQVKINFDDIDFVIQRLEPMKPPFPPVGDVDIEEYLADFSSRIFTGNKKYNLALGCFGDKEFPVAIGGGVGVKTVSSYFDDEEIGNKICQIGDKVVLKPNNSAQSKGVFAVEIVGDGGLGFDDLLKMKLADLVDHQLYKLRKGVDLNEVVRVLLFVQAKKSLGEESGVVGDFAKDDFALVAKKLYNDEVLLQPFFEGVAIGDIRVNLLKVGGKFRFLGAVLRKSVARKGDFTTCLTGGQSLALKVEEVLTLDEQNDLSKKVEFVVEVLNGKLKDKYRNCYELGLDFLILGDKKQVFLGEANHYCPALMPLVERLYGFEGKGLGFAKEFIKDL